jgi:hypothetical protein
MRQVFMQRNAAAAAVREVVVVKKVGAHHDVKCLRCAESLLDLILAFQPTNHTSMIGIRVKACITGQGMQL